MKKPLIITTLLLSTLFAKAQNVTKAQPDSIIKVIPIEDGRHTSYVYTIGGKLQTPEDVKIRILAYAPSAAEYKSSKNELIWSYVSIGATVGFSTAASALFFHHSRVNMNNFPTAGFVNGQPGFIYPPQHHTSLTGAYIFTGAAAAFFIATFVHFAKAAKHGDKALKLYNQQYQ